MLKVDSREDLKIDKILEREGVEFTRTTLPVGDLVYEPKGIVIERKTTEDFIQSMQSGHLAKQLLQMENFPHPFLIISGSLKEYILENPDRTKWTMHHHIGALVSCLVRYKTKLLVVENDRQLIRAVVRIIEKVDDGRTINIYDTELLRTKFTEDDLKLKILMCLPRIGLVKARKIISGYPTIKEKLEGFLGYLKEEGVYKG